MFMVLAQSGVDVANAFINDCNVRGHLQDWRGCWQDTLLLLRTLARFGFMVNLRKCLFLVTNAPVLGLDLCKAGYALGMKYMGNLHKVGIPTDLKGLQSLLGKLMYASAHVPHYKQRVGAIEKLLTCKVEVHWTVGCK